MFKLCVKAAIPGLLGFFFFAPNVAFLCLEMGENSFVQNLIFVTGLFCSILLFAIASLHYLKLPADKYDLKHPGCQRYHVLLSNSF